MRNVFVNVFKSDAVIWWAAIFCTPSSMFDKLLHLSKSKSFAMSCLRSHDLREAISDLLTVTMYLPDSLSKLHRPGLHKIDLCHCEVLRNLSQCARISTLSESSSCLPAAGHDVCSSRQLVLVHLFEDFHAFQEIDLFLTSLLLGRHCHVLVSLEETFCRRLKAVTHFVSLLKS